MKILLLSFLLLSMGHLANSQDVRDTAIENSLFWEVKGPGLSTPSYLYGTIHLACVSDVFLAPVILEKLRTSRIFYIETLYGKADMDPSEIENPAKNGMKDFIGNRNFRKSKEIMEHFFGSLRESWLDSLSAVQFGQQLTQASVGCKIISYDDSLFNLAKQYKLEIRGLESKEEIEKHFPFKMKFAPDRAWFVSYIDNNKRHPAEYKLHMARYNKQEVNWLYNQAAYN